MLCGDKALENRFHAKTLTICFEHLLELDWSRARFEYLWKFQPPLSLIKGNFRNLQHKPLIVKLLLINLLLLLLYIKIHKFILNLINSAHLICYFEIYI